MNRHRRYLQQAAALLLALILLVPAASYRTEGAVVTPPPPKLTIDKTEITMLVGDTAQITIDPQSYIDYIGEEWRIQYNKSYFGTTDPLIVTTDEHGVITAHAAGQAAATAGFAGMYAECLCTVLPHYMHINCDTADICIGDTINLSIDTDLEILYSSYAVFNSETGMRSTSSFSMTGCTDSDYSFRAITVGSYRIDISCTTDEGTFTKSCYVTIHPYGLQTVSATVAVGATVELPLIRATANNAYSATTWIATAQAGSVEPEVTSFVLDDEDLLMMQDDSDDYDYYDEATGISDFPVYVAEQIVTATENGKISITGRYAGDTTVTVLYTDSMGRSGSQVLTVHVTQPVYSSFTDYLEVGLDYVPRFSGLHSQSDITVYADSAEKLRVNTDEQGRFVSFSPRLAGQTTLYMSVDGLSFIQNVTVVDPQLTFDSVLLLKDTTHSLGVTGIPDGMMVSYSSSNTGVCTVAYDGTVYGVKKGTAYIDVSIDNGRWMRRCGVTVGNAKNIKATLQAEAVLGAEYSQPKRMREGFYDCSSLVFRCFKAANANIATSYSSNAPTAAEICRLQENAGYTISYGYLPADELQPGDLIFYRTTIDNKRYRNIGHVAIYYGPSYDPQFDCEINTGKIIHAFDSVEFYDYANFRTERIAMISRPFKK